MKTALCSILALLTLVKLPLVPNSFAQDSSIEYVVRVIYFLPNDRKAQPDIDAQLNTLMKEAQQFYADVMETYGFGRKTFRLETDADRKVVVHHVTGQSNDTFYHNGTVGKVKDELNPLFNTSKNIYFAAVDIGSERFEVDLPDSFICGQASDWGAFTPASGTCFNFRVIAHELGHTFGLTHDRYNRSGIDAMVDSFCTAEWLDVHSYFNAGHQINSNNPTTIRMIPPNSASSPNAIRFRFEVTDTDGLHQAQLYVPDLRSLIACEGLNGDPDANVEFVTTKVGSVIDSVYLRVIDTNGNISEQRFAVDITNLLPPPKVVTIPDASLSATVREYLNLSANTTLTTHAMQKLTGLFSNSDSQIADITGLEHATNLVALSLYRQNAITNISSLRELKNLVYLELAGTSISDVSVLAELTNLKTLYLNDTDISDVSALAELTKLKTLELQNTAVSDLSPLIANAGLGNGDYVDVSVKALNYASIYTHIPTLQERGIEVRFSLRTPQSIRIVSGVDQQAMPGDALANPFVIEVRDKRGVAFEGVPVTFTITAGGGTLNTQTTMTDPNGRAESILTLGPNAGTNTVTVSVTGSQETRTFNAEASRIPKKLEIISGVDQEGLPGDVLEKPFVVEVRDQTDKPLPGVEVTFTVTAGGGTLSATHATTDENGRAENTLTLGPNAGTNTVTVSVIGPQEQRTFNAEGIRIPKTLKIVSGAEQEGIPGAALEKQFVVEVRDQSDKPLPGAQVMFTVAAGGGTLSATSATTDSNGRAESTLTLGPNPGTNTVTVSVTGSQETRTFNAEASRIPKKLEIISGVDQEGLPGDALEKPFVVEVRDQTDKPLPGVEVTFTVTAGGGTLSATHATTDENGRAESTLTLGSTPGINTVRVSVEGNTQAVASLTIETARMPMFALSIPAGTHTIHIPLAVKQINGEDATIDTVADLYNALGDAVNYIITVGDDGGWKTYLGNLSAGSAADAAIGDDTGLVVVMSDAKTLELVGDALGTDSASMINIDVGNNLVGLPLKPSAGLSMISDLLVDGVGAIAVSNAAGDDFHTIQTAGDTGDGPIVGGVGYIVVATVAANIPIGGSAWENSGAVSAAPAVAFDGTHTPVLYVEGGVIDDYDMLSRIPELRVTVKNLSTGASLDTVLGTELSTTAYSATFVELSRHAAKVGEVLEIVAHSPNPFVGVRPVPQIVVSAEEVLTSRISLPDLELYEIPSETVLLANYPNPFNPETWIPYRLAKTAEVTLDIYDATGRLVRTIDIGFKPAAVYESRASAIYWDGRNNYGERVASGTYFYHLSAGDYSATRKMLVLK